MKSNFSYIAKFNTPKNEKTLEYSAYSVS